MRAQLYCMFGCGLTLKEVRAQLYCTFRCGLILKEVWFTKVGVAHSKFSTRFAHNLFKTPSLTFWIPSGFSGQVTCYQLDIVLPYM